MFPVATPRPTFFCFRTSRQAAMKPAAAVFHRRATTWVSLSNLRATERQVPEWIAFTGFIAHLFLTPPLFHIPDNGLSTLIYMDVLHRHFLLAFTPVLVQRL